MRQIGEFWLQDHLQMYVVQKCLVRQMFRCCWRQLNASWHFWFVHNLKAKGLILGSFLADPAIRILRYVRRLEFSGTCYKSKNSRGQPHLRSWFLKSFMGRKFYFVNNPFEIVLSVLELQFFSVYTIKLLSQFKDLARVLSYGECSMKLAL